MASLGLMPAGAAIALSSLGLLDAPTSGADGGPITAAGARPSPLWLGPDQGPVDPVPRVSVTVAVPAAVRETSIDAPDSIEVTVPRIRFPASPAVLGLADAGARREALLAHRQAVLAVLERQSRRNQEAAAVAAILLLDE